MSQVPDSSEATVRIPVRIEKGRITYLYSRKRLPLRDGAVGELVLPAQAVLDRDWLSPLKAERPVEIVPAGESLLLAMRLRKIPAVYHGQLFLPNSDRLRNHFQQPEDLHTTELPLDHFDTGVLKPLTWGDDAFVEVKLVEPLSLVLRGTKSAILRGGECRIPVLDRQATSLNHAYTVISEVFEPERRSHTGNVFDRVRYFEGTYWRRLDDLRADREAEYEKHLIAEATKRRRRVAPAQGTLDFK